MKAKVMVVTRRSRNRPIVVRTLTVPTAVTLAVRADDAEPAEPTAGDGLLGETLTLRFAPFGTWYEIDSYWEGQFLERVLPGAFAKTIREGGGRKVLFNHGLDLHIGDKILGVPSVLAERDDSPYAEVPLLDTSYNRDLVPALRVGGYGSSFMFEVLRESWDREPEKSAHNPDGLPERSVQEVRLYEEGPVTWPANPSATAGLRSHTDWYCEQIRAREPERLEELAARFNDFRAEHGLRTPELVDAVPAGGTSTSGAATNESDAPARSGHPSAKQRRERLYAFLGAQR